MELNLKNKNVLVVGASKGIGRAITLAFAKEGCKLVTIARTESLLAGLGVEAYQLGCPQYSYVVEDITKCDTQELTKILIKRFGLFDIVIHNVGTSLLSRNINGGYKDWEAALRINALASIDMNSVLIPSMIKGGVNGHIIHVSSISATYLRGNPLYASSKAFLNAYVTTAGREVASKGIVLNAIMPGAVSFHDSYWDKLIQNNDPKVNDFLRHHQAINRFV